jgi:hypothetical protein
MLIVTSGAHLEYDQESGTACWDRFGNAIEVWKADEVERGSFHRVSILEHDCETRGFQLSRFNDKETLCVVSSEGKGFVWDLSVHPPRQQKVLEIENEAVGHLDQGKDTVCYSMGTRGYHVCSKTTGELMGRFDPKECRNIYHIAHPPPQPNLTMGSRDHGPTAQVNPPQAPRKDRLTPLKLYNGPHPVPRSPLAIENDEWGSGIISGNYMCGVSRGGRVFICTDFLGALADPVLFQATTAIIHTEGDGSTFELGGWLTLRNGRAAFEVIDNVYIFSLPEFGQLPKTGEEQRPIWATSISSAPQLAVPVSFMGIYDDCIMYTYTTLGFRSPSTRQRRGSQTNRSERTRAFPTKAIRILSLAPELSRPGKELSYIEGLEVNDDTSRSTGNPSSRRGNTNPTPQARGAAMQAGLLQLMALLTNNPDDSDSETSSNHQPQHPDLVLDEAGRAELYASITEAERTEWVEDDDYDDMLEAEDRQQIAEMMGFRDEGEAMEMLRSDDEDEIAVGGGRGFYAPSLDDYDEDEDEWEDEVDAV